MGAFDLIRELRGAGVIVRADGGELDVSPADLLTDENIKALKRHKLEILALLKVGAGDTATASRWWRLHHPDRVVEVSFNPEATHAEILEWHPDAVAAEPFTPTVRQPLAPLTADEETAIRAWLAKTGETDPPTIAQVLAQCLNDADAQDYFKRRARGLPC